MDTLSHLDLFAQDSVSLVRSLGRQARSTLLRLGLLGALALLPVASVPLTVSTAVAPATIANVSLSSPCSGVSLPC